MKKLFIGLLVVAAGGATFFLLNQKKKPGNIASINKELIIGKWKPAASQPADTAQPHYQYEFQKDGIALRSLNNTVKADTTYYGWNAKNELVIRENTGDTTGKTFTVVQLTGDSLQLQAEKNAVSLLLTKAK
jgi:hypothetical protein